MVGPARCAVPGACCARVEELQTSHQSHLDSVGRNEKIRTHPRRNILGGDVQVSAKLRGLARAGEGRCWPPGGAHQFRRHIF